jgi:SNF2 family DNA or RNA helicase
MEYWRHQRQTIDKFKETRRGLDLSDPGTGKTSAHLGLYNERQGRGRMLISAPMTLMASAWGSDIDRFFPNLTYSLATAKNRFEAFESGSDIVIINTDGVKALTQRFPKRLQLMKFLKDFDHLVVDEVSFYKHPTSARSRAAGKISQHFDWRFGLSGTPNPKSVTELWHPAMIVDGGQRLGGAFTRFRNAMQEPTQVGPSTNMLRWDDKPQANEIAHILLRDIMIRHAFEEVMTDVPPNHVDMKYIFPPSKLMKMYGQLSETTLLAFEDGTFLNPVHAASLRNKLLQLCSGAVYTSEDQYVVLDSYRYELIADLVEERQHSVTFFNWKHQKDQLIALFQKRGITFELIDGTVADHVRPQIVADYQAGRYQTLLIQPKTGAHGLTLTRGTTVIVASPLYEPDYLKQIIHRIYRGGQTEVTNTLLVCAKGTVEELVYDRLLTGKARMDEFLSMVQADK